MSDAAKRLTRRDALILCSLAGIYVALGALYIARTSFIVDGTRVFTLWDDAMISMRYAANLRAGHGLVWNPGEAPVQGYSNLGVTLLMTAVHALPLSPLKISLVVQVANLAGLVAIMLLTWRIARLCFPERPSVAHASALAVVISGPLSLWGLQGSDTTAVSLWLLLGLHAVARAEARSQPWPLSVLAWMSLGVVLRLDFALYTVIFIGFFLRGPGRRPQVALWGLGSLAVVLGGLLGFGALYYGDPLPNTYYLKATGQPQLLMLAKGAVQVAYFWPGLILALALGGYVAFSEHKRALVVPLFVCTAAAVAYTAKVGGDWLPQYGLRFAVPALPPLLILCMVVPWNLMADQRAEPTRFKLLVYLAVAGLVALAINPRLATSEWLSLGRPTMLQLENRANVAYGLYFRDHTRPATRIAVHWGGISPYLSERPAVDVLGKSDRHIARMEVDDFQPGHSKWDWPYVLRTHRPDIFAITSRGLRTLPYFRTHYRRAEVPGELSFYVRTDAVDKIRDERLVLAPVE